MKLAPRISRNLPVPLKRQRDGMDRQHVANVGDCPCCICGSVSNIHAHHLLRTGEHGMGIKSPDKYCIPLCVVHHRELHDAGDEESYLMQHGVDGRGLATSLWGVRGLLAKMIAVVLKALDRARLNRDSRPLIGKGVE